MSDRREAAIWPARAPRRPLLALSCCFALGAALGGAADAFLGPLLAASAVLLSVLIWRPAGPMSGASVMVAAVALGVAGANVERREHDAASLRTFVASGEVGDLPVVIDGTLVEDPDEAGSRWALVVDVASAEVRGGRRALTGRARVQVDGQARRPQLMQGDRVRLWARLELPRGPRNPGGFDRLGYSQRRGIHVTGYCKSPALVRAMGRGDVGWLRRGVARLRHAVRTAMLARLHPGPDGGIVRAMVLGDRGGLDDETEDAFRVAGTYHVLALSGAQVALIAGLILWGVRWLARPPTLEAALAIAGISGYALFVGGDIPVTRAALMAAVLLAGRALGFVGEAANLLGLAALVLLAFRPSWIGDAGFQLSFAATLALVLLTPVIQPLFERVRRLPRIVAVTLAASAAAQLGVTPLLAWHFNRLAPAALLLNLVAIPLSSVVLLAGFGIALFSWLPPLAKLSVFVAEGAAALMRKSSALALVVPGADLRAPRPTWPLLLLFAVALVALALRPRRRGRAFALLCAATGGLIVGIGGPRGDGRLHLTMLDVGEGESLVLRSPGGRVLLVDTAGLRRAGGSVAESVVGPYLWSLGLTRVDVAVLTHPHGDHVGGAPFLLRSFRVDELWEGPIRPSELRSSEIARAARRAGVARLVVYRGFRRLWDGVEIEALWPPPVMPAPWVSLNDRSLVLRLRLGGVACLLTGDITAASEAALDGGRAAVLKVAHHGSHSSSSEGFVAAVRPCVALVSCGHRGALEREVLERYARGGVRVLRTDRDGGVSVATDGRRLWVGAAERPAEIVWGCAVDDPRCAEDRPDRPATRW